MGYRMRKGAYLNDKYVRRANVSITIGQLRDIVESTEWSNRWDDDSGTKDGYYHVTNHNCQQFVAKLWEALI